MGVGRHVEDAIDDDVEVVGIVALGEDGLAVIDMSRARSSCDSFECGLGCVAEDAEVAEALGEWCQRTAFLVIRYRRPR